MVNGQQNYSRYVAIDKIGVSQNLMFAISFRSSSSKLFLQQMDPCRRFFCFPFHHSSFITLGPFLHGEDEPCWTRQS